MLPIRFPDLRFPERTLDLDAYVDQLMDADPAPPPRDVVHATVLAVRDWLLDVVATADRRGIDPALAVRAAAAAHDAPPTSAAAAAGGWMPPAPLWHAVRQQPWWRAELIGLLWCVLHGVAGVTARELRFRGMDRLRRAAAVFDHHYPKGPEEGDATTTNSGPVRRSHGARAQRRVRWLAEPYAPDRPGRRPDPTGFTRWGQPPRALATTQHRPVILSGTALSAPA